MPGYLPVWPPMIESPSFLHSWWKDLQYFAKLASLRVGGRLKSKSPNWGENPLVARSEANRWTDSHAEDLGHGYPRDVHKGREVEGRKPEPLDQSRRATPWLDAIKCCK